MIDNIYKPDCKLVFTYDLIATLLTMGWMFL